MKMYHKPENYVKKENFEIVEHCDKTLNKNEYAEM